MKTKKILIIVGLFLFVSIGLFFRFYGLENSPSSLGFDEASLGYNSYSLEKTGRDEWGYRLPLSLRSFDDYKPALYSYLNIPFIWSFGLTQASTRMSSAFWGAIGALFTLLIIKQLSKSKWPAVMVAGLFVTLSPWRLHFSRVALETNISASFFTIMVWCLINRHRNRFFRIGSVIFALLAIYSYHSARVAVPVLIVILALDQLVRRRQIIGDFFSVVCIFVFSLPIFLANGVSVLTRFNQTNLFSKFYPFIPTEIIGKANPWFSLTNHPIYYLAGHILGRTVSYFSPHNLTETIYPWVTKSAMVIVDNGMLGFLGTFLFVLGLINVLSRIREEINLRLLLYWILAGAIPAAVTWEWFHPFRSLNLFPALDIITALGLLFIFSKIYSLKNVFQKISLSICLVSFLFVVVLFNWLNELNYSVWINNGEFQPGGFREGTTLLMSLADKYPVIYVDTPQAQSYIFFLLYGKIDPQIIQNTQRNYQVRDGFPSRVFDFGKFVYKKFNWPSDKLRHQFIYYTQSEIKEAEFSDVPGAKLYKVFDPFGRWTASIITKD